MILPKDLPHKGWLVAERYPGSALLLLDDVQQVDREGIEEARSNSAHGAVVLRAGEGPVGRQVLVAGRVDSVPGAEDMTGVGLNFARCSGVHLRNIIDGLLLPGARPALIERG